MSRKAIAITTMSLGLVLAAGNAHAATVSFQEGVNGYTGTQDTWFSGRSTSNENLGKPNDITFRTGKWASANQQALLRFDDIIGNGSGQITPGAAVTSATLTLLVPSEPSSAAGEANEIYKMLVNWDEADAYAAAQWNDGESGGQAAIQTDGVEAATTPIANSVSYATEPGVLNGGIPNTQIPFGTVMSFDVTSVVQEWVNGDPNYGLMFQSLGLDGGNAFLMASSEYATESGRPLLEVSFIPEPVSLALLGLGGLMILRRRQ